ncbi:MAG TPA: hypothetical protein VGG91_21245, partial [Myxococcaceae bacterium]
ELSRSDWSKILVLVALLPVMALSELGNQQIYNTYLVWGDAQYARTFFGFEAPVTWLLSVDAFIALSMILLVVAFWRMWSRTHREPDEIVKLAIGAAISAVAPLLLVLGSLQAAAGGHKVSLAWGLGFHLVNSVGYALLFPVGLALYSRASPRAITGLMIGVFYLHLFLANMTVGRLGGLLETLGDVPFWLLHSGLMAAGCAFLVLFAVAFRPILAPTTEARE